MQIEQVHYTFKAHATYGFVVLARLFVVLFSPTILLAFSAATRAQQAVGMDTQSTGRNAIRPFRVHVLQQALDDLRRRIANTRWRGRAEDAFHVVIPSMPGYGFSGKPTPRSWTEPAYPTHLLQQARQRRSLCRVGAAAAFCCGTPCGFQTVASGEPDVQSLTWQFA